jgi:hypothetical protein
MKDEYIEKALEIGVGLLGALLLGGFSLLAAGRLGGDLGRKRRHAESPPSTGQVSPERHQNIGTSSPR